MAAADDDDEARKAAKANARAGVEAIFQRYHKLAAQKHGDLYDYDCMKRVELLDATPEGTILYKFVPNQSYANLNGVVHGGAYGVLFDMFTMSALGTLARPGHWDFMGGVTRALNISFLRAVPVGTPVWFRSRVVQAGKMLALIKGEMTNEDGSVVYATAEHHKVNTPMMEEHKRVRVELDEVVEERGREYEKRKKKKEKESKL